MKTPSHCPKCYKPLTNTLFRKKDIGDIWTKKCLQYDHDFTCFALDRCPDEINYIIITIDLTRQIKAAFDFEKSKILVYDSNNDHIVGLPFFEPELTYYDKVIEKVKKYITFS